ncbi:MAG TPA: Mth938-like domain-containing protein [Steroidobacteraceae bacterium]
MKLTVDAPPTANIIRGYSPEGFRIGRRDCVGSVIVSATTLIENWRPRAMADLDIADLEPAFALKPEVLLIGSGTQQVFPGADLLAALYGSKVGFEVMATGAACRTYNVMLSEGRVVAAALLLERR